MNTKTRDMHHIQKLGEETWNGYRITIIHNGKQYRTWKLTIEEAKKWRDDKIIELTE
jgi:hypothetical protein